VPVTPYADVNRLRATLERGGGGLPETDKALPTSWADDILLRHLVDATGIIDSRVGAVVAVPFVDPPDLIVGLCADIAAYRAWLSFRGSKDLGEEDPFVLRYRDAVALLRDIAKGDAVIPPTSGGNPSGGPVAFHRYDGDLFGMGDFGLGYPPDGVERPYSAGWGR